MKRVFVLLLGFLLLGYYMGFSQINIQKIDPPHWYVGMKNPVVQLMIYGDNIASASVTTLSEDVQISEIVRGNSQDYLFLYLDISRAQSGNVELLFSVGKNKKKIEYPLLTKQNRRLDNKSFTTEDVIYLLMPDRYANGDVLNDKIPMKEPYTVDRTDPNARHGGDLKGIDMNLEYLYNLGVTALWLNPVLENDMPNGSYHGYATTDYYKIDPRLGTNQDYLSLISNAHAKGIKVIMDMIFNHCGSSHIWRSNPPFHDWFNFLPSTTQPYVQTTHNKQVVFDPYSTQTDFRGTVDGWFVPSMPDLNQKNRHLAMYLIQNSIWWIEYAGIDGIRQDTYFYADFDMMVAWCKAVEQEYAGYNIVGENWYNNPIGSAWWQTRSRLGENKPDTHLPSTMDFHLQSIATEAFSEETAWNKGLQKVYENLSYDFIYPNVKNLVCFLENHDTDRFLVDSVVDLNQFKQGYTFLLTSRGIPQLYYGCEILMSGKKDKSDGYVRLDFPGGWNGDEINAFHKEGRTQIQNEAFDFLRKLLQWRKGNRVISEGTLKHYAPYQGVYAYIRSFEGKNIFVMLNGTDKQFNIDLAHYKEVLCGVTRVRDFITEETIILKESLPFAPRQIYVFEWDNNSL